MPGARVHAETVATLKDDQEAGPPASFPPRRASMLPFLPGVVMLFLCFFNLGHGLFKDEYLTWRAITMTAGELARDRLACGHLPTYFLLLKGWCTIFGDSEAFMRLPGVFFILAAFPVFIVLATDLFGRRVALFSGWIFATHQLVLWCAQTARPYSAILFFSLLCALCLVRWFTVRKPVWLVGAAGAVAGGFAFHALFGLTVAAFMLPMLISLRTDRRVSLGALAALLLPTLILTLPLLVLIQRQGNYAGPHPTIISPLKALKPLGRVALGDPSFWTESGVPAYTGAAVLVWLSVVSWSRLGRVSSRLYPLVPFPRRAFIFSWGFMPVALLAIGQGVFRKSILAHERYFVTALGGLILITAAGLASMGGPVTGQDPGLSRRAGGGRLAAMALVVVLLVPCTLAWLLQRGDGPKLVVAKMKSTFPPAIVAGYTEALDYELRRTPPRKSVSLIEMTAADACRKIESLHLKEPFWLFVYDNKGDNPLDELLKDPPSGFRAMNRIKRIDARAALMVPDGS